MISTGQWHASYLFNASEARGRGEMGELRTESEIGSKESGVWSREVGDGRRESGVGSREAGDRRREPRAGNSLIRS